MRKHLGMALFFFTLAFLSAQERRTTKLYIAPTSGGTPEAQAFFDTNIPMEVTAANYMVTDNIDEADYTIHMAISENPDMDDPSAPANIFTIRVIRAADSAEIVRFSWGYTDLEEMYNWNLYIIYNAMANIALNQEGVAGPIPIYVATPMASWRTKVFYVGVRTGASFTGYSPQVSANYEAGLSTGISGEGGVVVDIRVFRFFSIQAEAVFAFDTFEAAKIEEGNDGAKRRSTDTFTAISLMFPVLLKAPLELDKFIISFYAGAYFAMFPWQIEKRSGSDDLGNGYNFKVYPPAGFLVGADIGFSLGPGEFLADMRYGRDFGMTVIENNSGPQYIRNRMTVSIGYKFGIFKRKR